MKSLEHYTRSTNAYSWNCVWKFFHELGKPEDWIFRGMRNSAYDLQSSLERSIVRFLSEPGDSSGIEGRRRILRRTYPPYDLSARGIEGALCQRFQRQCHHFLPSVPDDQDVVEWLALMQHHGTPTRLLDWSYSFYVGLFFAVEDAEAECVVWAIARSWLQATAEEISPSLKDLTTANPTAVKEKAFHDMFNSTPAKRFAYTLNPYRLNQRLMVQQGVFLCPGDVCEPMEDNICALCENSRCDNKIQRLVIADDQGLRKEILRELYQMNITQTALFPGLDGFARSLQSLMMFPQKLRPYSRWP